MDAVTVRFFASRAEDTIPVAVRAEIWGQTVFSILSPGRAMAGIRCHTVAKMNDHEPLNLKPVHFHLATAVKLETKSRPDCQSKSTMVGTVGRRARGSRAEAT